MDRHVPSFFMLVPGPWREAEEIVRVLEERGIAAKLTESGPLQAGEVGIDVVQDDDLAGGFSWGRAGPLAAALVKRIGTCTHAALIQYGRRLDESAPQVAQLGRTLRDAGGVAVRMEASGAASAWEPWLEQLESGAASRIYASAVIAVQDDRGVLFTCGMHHFDLPDAQIEMADSSEALAWLDAFCVYQIEEQPALASGHTFRPYSEAARRVLERWPDHRHDPRDGRRNPFGLWRLQEPGSTRVQAGALIPTIVPSLVAILASAERSQGRPLTRSEVENVVSKSTAMSMEPAHALALERSRGYADIEPELAWEQWQIVRSTLD
jgi:hypothetical protein